MSWVSVGVAGAGLAVKGISAYQSYQRSREAQKKSNDLQNQTPPQHQLGQAQQRMGGIALRDIANPTGYTGAETGQFNQNLAKINAAAMNNASSMAGGDLSRAMLAGTNANAMNATNQFAAQGANLRRNAYNSGMGRYGAFAGAEQAVGNANTQAALNRRMMIERALGGAVQSNRDYAQGELTGMAGDVEGAGTQLLAKGLSDKYGYGSYDPTTSNGMTSKGRNTQGFHYGGQFGSNNVQGNNTGQEWTQGEGSGLTQTGDFGSMKNEARFVNPQMFRDIVINRAKNR